MHHGLADVTVVVINYSTYCDFTAVVTNSVVGIETGFVKNSAREYWYRELKNFANFSIFLFH